MTTMLRDVLDDVAAEAVRDLRIDLDDVQVRSRRRRARLRTWGTVTMLAAAAAVVVAIAVPVAPASTRPATGSSRVGLPDRWYFAPSFAPPVTRAHMAAASMVLAGDGTGPVLVSADTRTYARLPWGVNDAMLALSADGTWVAWSTQGEKQSTVHLLRLSDGKQSDAKLPAGSGRVSQLVWAGGQIYASTYAGALVRIDEAAGLVATVCTCGGAGLGVDSVGGLVQGVRGGVPDVPEVPALRPIDAFPAPGAPAWSRSNASAAAPSWFYVSSPVFAVAPDGKRSARAEWANSADGWRLIVSGDDSRRAGRALKVSAAASVTDAEILAWTDAGLLVRVDTADAGSRNATLELIDPDGGPSRTVSTRYEGFDVPMTVASGLVGDGRPIASSAPQFPAYDRDRIRYAADHVWQQNRHYWPLVMLAALTAATGLVVVRRRRRVSI